MGDAYGVVHILRSFGRLLAAGREGFSYAPGGEFQGEAALLLAALGNLTAGKAAEQCTREFQRRGFFWTHILECPFEDDGVLQTG